MKIVIFILIPFLLLANPYEEVSKKIIQDFNYIYQGRAWSGGHTFVKETKFKYVFKAISAYEIKITKSINGLSEGEPFILDIRRGYSVDLEQDTKCDPSLVISDKLEIIYLLVKNRCGNFGGFNLYKRAKDASIRLQEHLNEASDIENN